MDEQKVFVDLKPLTDEQIKENNFGLGDLWMVKIKGKDPYGPYDTQSLKEYSDKYEFLFHEAKVYNLESDEWSDMFSVSHFQRRKPQLVSAQNLISTQDFYILYNGQKDGPHTQEKIQTLLDQGYIVPSTQLSLDQGQSWIKLYEHHAFDRRTKKSNTQLPFRPNEDILRKVLNKKAQIIKLKEAEDAIVEFAYMGTNSDIESDIELELEDRKQNTSHSPIGNDEYVAMKKLKKIKRTPAKASTSNSHVWKFGGIFAVLTVAALAYYNTQIPQQVSSEKTAEVKTTGPSIDNSERQVVQKPERKPASLVAQPKPRVMEVKKAKAPQRIQRRPQKRFVRKAPVKEVFEKDIETIDINDPEVQEELTRQLAGEYEDEEPAEQDEEKIERKEVEENPYDTQEEAYPEDNYPQEDQVEQENY